jgi:hypothetical protein
MKDMKAHLDKLRAQISECELIRDLTTDKDKRAIFANLADHFKFLADELEGEIMKRSPIDTLRCRKTQEPFPRQDGPYGR